MEEQETEDGGPGDGSWSAQLQSEDAPNMETQLSVGDQEPYMTTVAPPVDKSDIILAAETHSDLGTASLGMVQPLSGEPHLDYDQDHPGINQEVGFKNEDMEVLRPNAPEPEGDTAKTFPSETQSDLGTVHKLSEDSHLNPCLSSNEEGSTIDDMEVLESNNHNMKVLESNNDDMEVLESNNDNMEVLESNNDNMEVLESNNDNMEVLGLDVPKSTVPGSSVSSLIDISLSQHSADIHASFLSSSAPPSSSLLEAGVGADIGINIARKEDLNVKTENYNYSLSHIRANSTHSSPSKSKLELKFDFVEGNFGSDQHLASTSKASLNYPEDRATLSDSETRKPRTRFRSTPSLFRTKSMCKERNIAQSDEQNINKWPLFDSSHQRDPLMGTEGRNALNYGPDSAHEDMLSDIRMLLSQESESEIDTESVEPELAAPSARENVCLRQRRTRPARRSEKKVGRKRRKRKHDLEREPEANLINEPPSSLKCPVCLDIFYNAYTLTPCGHIFCEPCLRHLAKCNHDSMRHTTCPVCREPVSDTNRNEELSDLVEFYHAEDFKRRHTLERNNRYMRHPLPSSFPDVFSPKHQLSRIVSRLDRNRLARRRTRTGTAPIRINLWRFVSLAFAFLLFKGLLLMVMLCLYCVIYDHGLHEKVLELSISGVAGFFRYLAMLTPKLWGFVGVFVFGASLVISLKFGGGATWLKPLPENPPTAF